MYTPATTSGLGNPLVPTGLEEGLEERGLPAEKRPEREVYEVLRGLCLRQGLFPRVMPPWAILTVLTPQGYSPPLYT